MVVEVMMIVVVVVEMMTIVRRGVGCMMIASIAPV